MNTQELHIRDNNKEAWESFYFLDGDLEVSVWSVKDKIQYYFSIDESTLKNARIRLYGVSQISRFCI